MTRGPKITNMCKSAVDGGMTCKTKKDGKHTYSVSTERCMREVCCADARWE